MIVNTLEYMYGYLAGKRGRKMTKLEAIRIMLEIVTECDKYDAEGNSCNTCPFGHEGTCLVSEGNDIPHNWQIKDKLREI